MGLSNSTGLPNKLRAFHFPRFPGTGAGGSSSSNGSYGDNSIVMAEPPSSPQSLGGGGGDESPRLARKDKFVERLKKWGGGARSLSLSSDVMNRIGT